MIIKLTLASLIKHTIIKLEKSKGLDNHIKKNKLSENSHSTVIKLEEIKGLDNRIYYEK